MSIKIPAAKAVHISEYYGNQNPIPLDRNLYIGRYKGKGDIYRSLIGFDLLDLPGLLPHGTTIGIAYLQILITRNEIPSGTIDASLWRCREEWDRTTVTWNNQPATVAAPDLAFTIPAGWTGWITLDATTLVLDWVSGNYPNYGFLLRGNELHNSVVAFSPEASLVIVPAPEKIGTGQVIGETVFMDYPLRPEPRYGYGKPSHPGLCQLLNGGVLPT